MSLLDSGLISVPSINNDTLRLSDALRNLRISGNTGFEMFAKLIEPFYVL